MDMSAVHMLCPAPSSLSPLSEIFSEIVRLATARVHELHTDAQRELDLLGLIGWDTSRPAPDSRFSHASSEDVLSQIRLMSRLLQDARMDFQAEDCVDVLSALESLKNAAAGAQAVVTAALAERERNRHRDEGVPAAKQGRGIAMQVGLARRESHHRGRQLLSLATFLTTDMPHTLAAMRRGDLTEYRATLLAREGACLKPSDRRDFDRAMCSAASTLQGVGTRKLMGIAARWVAQRDQESVVERNRRALNQRYVSIRPAADGMVYLSALLGVKEGFAAYGVLSKLATEQHALAAEHDGRTVNQHMADLLVARVVGASTETVPVQLNLVMTDRVLFGDHGSAEIPGYGLVSGETARQWLSNADVRVRRLFTAPVTGALVAMESKSRLFAGGLAELVHLRDGGGCRTPYCDAPVRNIDHIKPWATSHETTAHNGQGLCVACNLAKELPGWRQLPVSAANELHEVRITTPTGHQHRSRAPRLHPRLE